jgi:hypothetical protein
MCQLEAQIHLVTLLTLMSLAEGEVLPPRPRRRYAARCFILTVVVDVDVKEQEFNRFNLVLSVF